MNAKERQERQHASMVLHMMARDVLDGSVEGFEVEWELGSGNVDMMKKVRLDKPVEWLHSIVLLDP